MTFRSPTWLALLAGVAALAALYILAQLRSRSYAVRFTNLDLLDKVAPDRPGLRRHLPAAALLVALTSLVLGLARPSKQLYVAKERATVIVALDTSNSMMATDVEPDRLEAAKAAASEFVRNLPESLNVGLVEFHGTASVLVSPTQDRADVLRSISNLDLGPGTAIGEAIFAGLKAIQSMPPPKNGTAAAPARIVLMSDGETRMGRSNEEASQAALAVEVAVSTIAFGTEQGEITLANGTTMGVPVNKPALQDIADTTGGQFFEATSANELKAVYADIGSSLGQEREWRDISRWFTGAAMIALFAAAGMSLLWFSRLP